MNYEKCVIIHFCVILRLYNTIWYEQIFVQNIYTNKTKYQQSSKRYLHKVNLNMILKTWFLMGLTFCNRNLSINLSTQFTFPGRYQSDCLSWYTYCTVQTFLYNKSRIMYVCYYANCCSSLTGYDNGICFISNQIWFTSKESKG